MHKINWIIKQHTDVNHKYDGYLPYEFHLRLAYRIYKRYQHLLDDEIDMFMPKEWVPNWRHNDQIETEKNVCGLAVYGHDLLEDTHVTYNDIKNHLGAYVADVIYAVTNDKGKNRAERASEKHYTEMRNTPGAVFVKLCDRLANVTYSHMMNSSQLNMYKDEYPKFQTMLDRTGQYSKYEEMFKELDSLLIN